MLGISSMQIGITTHCNMHCPNCSWGIHKIPMNKRQHYSWEYLEKCANYFHGIDTIYIMGGEPTMHPNFEEWSFKFKELFRCKQLYLWTNGWGFDKISWKCFTPYDKIIVSKYTKNTFKGSINNSDIVTFFNSTFSMLYPNRVQIGEVEHFQEVKGGSRPCGREVEQSKISIYLEGKVYHCCGGVSIQNGIEISPTWKEDILSDPLNCHNCVFGL